MAEPDERVQSPTRPYSRRNLPRGHVMTEENPTVEYRIVPFATAYRVGNDGSVWTRYSRRGLGIGLGVEMYIGEKWKRLKPGANENGRLFVLIYDDDGNRKPRYVHRLVLESFVGPCPRGMECSHFPDRDPKNCNLSNPSWGTKKANQADRIAHGTDARGEKNKGAKLTDEMVRSIRKEYVPRKVTSIQLGRKYGVSGAKIRQIVARAAWAHVT